MGKPFPHRLSNKTHLCLLLTRCSRLCLCGLLPVAPYHNHAQERTNHGRPEKDKNDWYANGPNSRGEEIVKRMSLVNEWLLP